MIIDERTLGARHRFFDRIELLGDFSAVARVLDHLGDTMQMAGGAIQPLDDCRMAFVLMRAHSAPFVNSPPLTYPPGGIKGKYAREPRRSYHSVHRAGAAGGIHCAEAVITRFASITRLRTVTLMLALLAMLTMAGLSSWHDSQPQIHELTGIEQLAPVSDPDGHERTKPGDTLHFSVHIAMHGIAVPAMPPVLTLMSAMAAGWPARTDSDFAPAPPGSILRPPRV